jgi:hypothetical protein
MVNLSFSDKATHASLKVFASEVDGAGNNPLKVGVICGDYTAV